MHKREGKGDWMSLIEKTLANELAKKVEAGEISSLEAMERLPQLDNLFVSNEFSDKKLEKGFKAAVFNIERGMKLQQMMPYLKCHPDIVGCDIILANELDLGMDRTGNLDVTRVIAEQIGMNYVYGVEYVELREGENPNTEGLHGNAIFSRYKLHNPKLVRLPLVYDWFYSEQKRFGTRMVLFATADTEDGKQVGIVCVHLENRTTPERRLEQVKVLLEEAKKHFGSEMPVIMGGDMNTNAVDGDDDAAMEALGNDKKEQMRRICEIESIEPMLPYAEKQGFDYKTCNILHKSTRRKRRAGKDPILLNLDWFLQRGLKCENPKGVTAIFDWRELGDAGQQFAWYDGEELSDHDTILVECRL